MLLRVLSVCLLLVITLTLPVAAAETSPANEAQLKSGIVRMLEEGWSVTPAARATADAQYVELQTIAGGDTRLLTASVLVLLQQRRYDEAGKRLDQLLVGDDDNLFALRAKCWLAATLKNYGTTIAVAEKLRASLPAESTQDPAGDAVAREHLAFLGRICGYLAGPVADNVDQVARKQLERTVLAGLNEDRKLIFEEARDSVSQKYFELTDSKLDTEKKNVEERKVEAEQTLQDVEAARKEIEERAQELEDRGAKLQKELSDELAQIAKLDRPLVSDLARLQARADIISRDLGSYQVQIDRLFIQIEREMNPNIRASLRREADQLSFLARRVSDELAAVNRQGQAVQSQRAGLAARAQQAQNNFGGQLDRINKELVTLGKKEKRADYEEKKAKKPVSASSTKTIALSSLVTSLSTYDKFPLEQAKERLLSELK